jgi:RNA polymerase sigma factor (sigma-70 family)
VDQNARITPPADDDERAAARREHARMDAELVERARADDPDAFGELYDRWFNRVHDLAFRITRDSSIAPEVAQDAFVAAWRGLGSLDQPQSFGGWLLRITRNTALNRRRKELRSSPRDTEGMAVIEATRGSDAGAPVGFRVEDRAVGAADPARAAEDGEIAALVWESAEALGERDAEVLDLTLRHGLSPAEVGDVIGINRNAANQTVHRVRARLKSAVQARVLWRGGEPVCGDLADALGAEGVRHFGPDAVRIATAHAETCVQCGRRRELKLEPSALFAATPFLAVPLLKTKIAHALSEEGVPMGEIPATPVSVDAPSGPPQHRWRNRLFAGAGVVVLALVAVGVLAEDIDEFTTGDSARSGPRVTTTTAPAPTTTEPPVVLPPPVVTTDAAPPAPPPVTATISITPTSAANSTFSRPTLTWSTQNASTVEVFGPNFSSSAASGSAMVCPGSPAGPFCTAPPGPYTYTIRARDADGNVVAEQAVTFTKTP